MVGGFVELERLVAISGDLCAILFSGVGWELGHRGKVS